MGSKNDCTDLDRTKLESELALKRLERMIEFLRLLHQKEAQIVDEAISDKKKRVHLKD